MTRVRFTVLGSRGFVGSHLVAKLGELDHECLTPARGQLPPGPLGHVVYAIGLTADFRTRPLDTVEAHVCVLRELLAAGNFDSLTYLSSTRVYTGAADTAETATLRVNPLEASDLYNLSKLMGESLCLHGGRPNVKVARLSNIVGLRPDPDIFIDQLLEEGRETGRVLLRTSLQSRKDYLYIDDATTLIIDIALSTATGVFNVASGEGVSNGEIATLLKREMGFTVDMQPGAPTWEFTSIDISKSRAAFEFSPRQFADYFPEFLSAYRLKHGIR
jgi:nucleoside-diphosphate-sugar epimerase